MAEAKDADLVVIGGGPAGSALATVAAEAGLRVILLERRSFPRPRIGESLTPKVTPLLSILGTRTVIEGAGFVRMAATTVDHGAGRETHPFDPEGRKLGFQADRARFDQLLLERAKEVGVRVQEGQKVVGLLGDASRVTGVEWASPNAAGRIEAQVVADASGGAAVVARALGLRERGRARTVALAGYFGDSDRPRDFDPADTLFEMIDEGWIWSVLHADGRRNVTVGLDAERVRGRSSHYQGLYFELIGRSRLVAPLLRGARLLGPLTTHDATWRRARRYAGAGWLLAGDAASVIDPLTSQGVYKALQSGIVGAAVVQTVLRRPRDAALAVQYYQDSQARFSANYSAIALSFYRRSPHQDAPFWRARRASDFADGADAEPADLPGRAERRRRFTDLVSTLGGERVQVAIDPAVTVVSRPAAVRGYIEAQTGWSAHGVAIDSAGVDAAALLEVLRGGTVAQVFEGYVARTGQERSVTLARSLMLALGNLAERELLSIQT